MAKSAVLVTTALEEFEKWCEGKEMPQMSILKFGGIYTVILSAGELEVMGDSPTLEAAIRAAIQDWKDTIGEGL